MRLIDSLSVTTEFRCPYWMMPWYIGFLSHIHANGEQTQDLLVNLLKGYKACKGMKDGGNVKKKKTNIKEEMMLSTKRWLTAPKTC